MKYLQQFYGVLIGAFLLFTITAGCSTTANVKSYSSLQGDDDDILLSELNVTTSAGMTLDVESDVGSVKIKPGSGNEVRVKVYGNEDTKQKVNYNAVSSSNGVNVKGKIKDEYKNNQNNLRLRFEIEVPSSYNIKVTTGGGSISINDISGDVSLNTGGGGISLEEITGDINVNTGGGSVKIVGNLGEVSVNTGGGSVRLNSFDGNVNINTGGGSVSMIGANGSVNVNTGGGSISLDYTGSNRGIALVTGGGSISLDIPSNFAADVDLNTSVGTISTDFGKADKNGMGSNLKTTINGGGEKLECHTSAGSIKISTK